MSTADERDPTWGPVLGGATEKGADDVVVDVDDPDDLLLDPVDEPEAAALPEQWEVLADDDAPDEEAPLEPPPTFGPSGVDSAPERPKVEEIVPPPVAVPVLHHIVEAPVVEAEPEPEPEPEPIPEPEPEPAWDFEEELAPVAAAAAPVHEPAPAPAPARPWVPERVPPTERATSAAVLLLLAVVVGIALAGLVAAVILVITLVVRRALGA
ncbi:MAG: hypothetical protein JO367_12055 [Actinobacteria bacterium]|nr:hypothetical protein [Actinomycetota bacterium]